MLGDDENIDEQLLFRRSGRAGSAVFWANGTVCTSQYLSAIHFELGLASIRHERLRFVLT